MYTIYDSAVNVYSDPFLFQTDQEAIRTFTQTVHSEDTKVGQNPEDFTLMSIGEMENSSALMNTHAPEKIVGAWELINRNEPEH